MLIIKALHIISMVAEDSISINRFKIMERRLYYGITWPAAIVTSGLGILLITYQPDYYLKAGWMHAKFTLVLLVWFYHLGCGHFLRCFAQDRNNRSSRFYRLFNEIPTLLLISIVLLAVVQP